MIRLGPNIQAMNPAHLSWACISGLATEEIIFDFIITFVKFGEDVEWVVCNSSIDRESGAFKYAPLILSSCLPMVRDTRMLRLALTANYQVGPSAKGSATSFSRLLRKPLRLEFDTGEVEQRGSLSWPYCEQLSNESLMSGKVKTEIGH